MHIGAGLLKGMSLSSVEGSLVRPTKSSVREALFNILGQDLSGISFADLCAGTGAMGIEALSRNAANVSFVETDRRAFKILSQNVEKARERLGKILEVPPAVEIRNESYHLFLQKNKSFDVLFFDPPHADYEEASWRNTAFDSALKPGGVLILEHARYYPRDLPNTLGELELVKTRKYGQSMLSFFKRP